MTFWKTCVSAPLIHRYALTSLLRSSCTPFRLFSGGLERKVVKAGYAKGHYRPSQSCPSHSETVDQGIHVASGGKGSGGKGGKAVGRRESGNRHVPMYTPPYSPCTPLPTPLGTPLHRWTRRCTCMPGSAVQSKRPLPP